MKKIKIGIVSEVYNLLDAAKYSKMESADRRALVKAMRPLKKVSADFNDFRDDAIKRLRPDNFVEISQLVEKFNALDSAARRDALADNKYMSAIKAFNAFQADIAECLRDEVEREVELEFEALDEKAVDRLLDSNDQWTVGQAMLVEEILGATE